MQILAEGGEFLVCMQLFPEVRIGLWVPIRNLDFSGGTNGK